MKLRQLVYLHEVTQQAFNISAAAKALYTSQPGISRQLQDFAGELGVELFRHQGKRLIGLTPAGEEIAAVAAGMIRDIKRIKEIAAAHESGYSGGLVIVATRHAAANRLHEAMIRCQDSLPTLDVRVFEEDPANAATMLREGDAHLGVLSEPPVRSPDLVYFPLEEWRLLLVVPRNHPLTRLPVVTLAALTGYPACSYEGSARSRQVLDETFRAAGLRSPVSYSLGSSAKILQYVATGVSIGFVGEADFLPANHPDLQGIDVSYLFRPLTTDLVLPRKERLSDAVRAFAKILAPTVTLAWQGGPWADAR
jgi:LysR family cys regulon transcriptional activator